SRVPAGRAGKVRGQAPPDVSRPPAIEGVVGAAKQIDAGHAHGFAGATTVTCSGGRVFHRAHSARKAVLLAARAHHLFWACQRSIRRDYGNCGRRVTSASPKLTCANVAASGAASSRARAWP